MDREIEQSEKYLNTNQDLHEEIDTLFLKLHEVESSIFSLQSRQEERIAQLKYISQIYLKILIIVLIARVIVYFMS